VKEVAELLTEVRRTVSIARERIPWIPVADDHDILRRITLRATILANDEQLASRHLLRQIRHR
ncbi:MAG TPA: hypothetical protein VFJ07_19890, partial [Streptosporangiaceae bacterium]|nr:hypothetical protein [Streptosporangiaceae bacterium]